MWYVVRNGEIVFVGSEQQAIEIIENDITGQLEMYPQEGRIEYGQRR